jgi:hypothetical protein
MLRLALASAALLALSACTVCDRYAQFEASFQEKHKACLDSNGEPFNKAACSDNLKNCSPADQEKLNKYLDCMDKIPACTSGTNLAFLEAQFTCAMSDEVRGISSACGAGF